MLMLLCLATVCITFGEQRFRSYQELVLLNSTQPYNAADSPYDVFHQPVDVTLDAQSILLTGIVGFFIFICR